MGRVYTFPWDFAGFVVREWQQKRDSVLTRWDARKAVSNGDRFLRTVGVREQFLRTAGGREQFLRTAGGDDRKRRKAYG